MPLSRYIQIAGITTATAFTAYIMIRQYSYKHIHLYTSEQPTLGMDEESKQASRLPSRLYVDVAQSKWPIVYSDNYNIGFFQLQKLHPFDTEKWGRVFHILKEQKLLTDEDIVTPLEAKEEDLLLVHTKRYLDSLKGYFGLTIAKIAEVPPLAAVPNSLLNRHLLTPLRLQTGGTVLAAKLAVDRGWAINIGGGFHHASSDSGGGFCFYADISLAIKLLFQYQPDRVQKVMIIDLDAHQGNGHETDFMNDKDKVYILDVYNRGIYPRDFNAKKGITRNIEIQFYMEDDEYLKIVDTQVEGALNEFKPDLVVYNAGTDILAGDHLGLLSITETGVVKRDELVFTRVLKERNIPIVMVTSGGYQSSTARVIANSILNLHAKQLITNQVSERIEK